jgi:hypothetical protein
VLEFSLKQQQQTFATEMERIPATSSIPVAAGTAATAKTPATAGEASNNGDASKSSKAKHQLVGKQKNCVLVKLQEEY